MLKKIAIILFMIFSAGLQAQTVKIAAAANLRFVLEEIISKYTNLHPNTNIVINLGASGVLVQQITNGADFDLFMAADRTFPEKLKATGLAKGEVTTYAFGKLVLWSKTMDLSGGLDILTGRSVNRIAVANPELAPYGVRAVECLKYYNLFERVRDKIVYAENISQAAQFAQTGNAEVGFLAYSLILAPEMKGFYFVPDPKSYKPVEQALILIKDPKSNSEAENFLKFVLGRDCKPIFEKHGFIVP
jgi:molybdate transport system substrate-binding protein